MFHQPRRVGINCLQILTGEYNKPLINLYQKGAPGILVNTSAMTMKANPVPWAESSSSLTREQFLRRLSGWSLDEVSF